MSSVHAVVGFALLAIFTVGWVWAVVAVFLPKRDPGRGFWIWLSVAQIAAGLQAVLGVILLLMGRQPTDWLHLVYGFGPILILLIGHALSRELKRGSTGLKIPPWGVFGAASFICFGLSLRAWMTGLGMG
jgi:hypothetical protein